MTTIADQYEAKTQEIAKELITATRQKGNIFSAMRDQMRLDDQLLGWAMSNPHLRVQLFHFIDTLPALRSNQEIAKHFQEYLSTESVELPSTLKNILNFTEPSSIPAQLAATTISKGVEVLANKYISGANIQQVIKTIERLRKDKMTFSIDLLGEAVITEIEAQSYFNKYIELIDQLSTQAQKWANINEIDRADGEDLFKVQVSVKLTAFYSQFDPFDPEGSEAKLSNLIRALLRHDKEKRASIHFDMEQYKYKDLTLSILKNILMEDEFRTRTDVGIVLQCYLRESYADLEGMISWAKKRAYPITVRLVIGIRKQLNPNKITGINLFLILKPKPILIMKK